MDKITMMKPPIVLAKKYPLVEDLSEVLSKSVVDKYEGERAIDVLDAPIYQLTNLYDRILTYLYNNHTKEFTRKELSALSQTQGYEAAHIKKVMEELETDLRISSWWDSQKREIIFRWIYQTEADYQKRVDDNEWFKNLPG